MHRSKLAILPIVLLALALGAPAAWAGPRADADWTEVYFPANDGLGTMLHADVLRPKGAPDTLKTPVILTVTPYANHSGSTYADLGFTSSANRPNVRFYDFLDLSAALKNGYTYVMVDLPGFGGSGGCNDWGGAREQGATKAAVEWAAAQPWSNGRVALFGKSYDGWTGLMGISRQPQGLAAVVAMEPVFSGYRYLYNNGVRFGETAATISAFQVMDVKPGTISDTPQYHLNGAPQAWCYGVNSGMSSSMDDEASSFWRERNLVISSTGEDTPLFLTQGFLEENTKPDAAFDYWSALDTTNSRAWFGQFDHWRGWEKTGTGSSARYRTGRSAFMQELMRFLELHLKGVQPAVEDPPVAVQDNRGKWRGEYEWPPSDMRLVWSDLNTGAYSDGVGSTRQIWSFSQPLEHDVWLAGEPVVKVEATAAVPRANLVANVFDVSPSGDAVLINRGTTLLREQGHQFAALQLYGQDWRVPAGHRIGVLLADADAHGWWLHVPTGQSVTVHNARIGLPALRFERDADEYVDGSSTADLDVHLSDEISVSSRISAGQRTFTIPGPLQPRPEEFEPA